MMEKEAIPFPEYRKFSQTPGKNERFFSSTLKLMIYRDLYSTGLMNALGSSQPITL
jgi:hypothetical protein